MAWSVNWKDRGEVVINGKVVATFREVRRLFMSSNGKTYACFARRNPDAWFAVINGKEQPECEEFDFLFSISADGTTVAYRGDDLQIGGRRVREPAGFCRVHLSPDGRTVLFETREKGDSSCRLLDANGWRGPPFFAIEPPSFAPDGVTFAYGALDGPRSVVVLGDRAIETPGRISAPALSGDGLRIGYGARIGREIWWKVIETR